MLESDYFLLCVVPHTRYHDNQHINDLPDNVTLRALLINTREILSVNYLFSYRNYAECTYR